MQQTQYRGFDISLSCTETPTALHAQARIEKYEAGQPMDCLPAIFWDASKDVGRIELMLELEDEANYRIDRHIATSN